MAKIYSSSDSSGRDTTSTSDDEESGPRFTLEPMAYLPFLPEDCLLAIMKYLGPVDLKNLSRVCDRTKVLVADKRLWKKIDFRPYRLSASQLMYYLKFFNRATTYIAIQGFVGGSSRSHWSRKVISPHLLESISWKCPFLETLILERIMFERIWTSLPADTVKRLSLTLFPATITYLSLKKSIVTGLDSKTSYFQGMHYVFPNLKVLILSDCHWVSPHDFMAISKCLRLEELRMNGCSQLGECVAYTSLAARFGFPSLKILDLKNTRMGDSDVIAFRHTTTLTHLYLECPSSNSDEIDSSCDEVFCDDDLTESTEDEDEMEMSSVISPKIAASRVCLLPPVPNVNSSPLSSPRQSQNCERDVRNDIEKGVGIGDVDLPHSTTSSETLSLNTSHNSGGPSPVKIGRKHIRPRKRPSDDSESNNDENNISKSNIMNFDTSDTEIVESSNESADGSSSPDKKVKNTDQSKKSGCISAKHKRQCSDTDSILSNNNSDVVHMPKPTDPYSNVAAGSSSSVQHFLDLLPPSPVVIVSSAGPTSSSEGNNENGSELQLVNANLPFFMPPNIDIDLEDNDIFNPNFYYLPDNGDPFNETTISDMCVMSFVLDDAEADRVGYVRLVSPESRNARSQLHTLVLRNYRMITDATLQYLSSLRSLRYLDVSGTSVTEGGVLQFKLNRPEVQVICDFKDLPI